MQCPSTGRLVFEPGGRSRSAEPRRSQPLGGAGLVAVESSSPRVIVLVSAEMPLRLRRCGKADFKVWHLAPRMAGSGGWALVGEAASKWVAVSPARFLAVESLSHRSAAGHAQADQSRSRRARDQGLRLNVQTPTHKRRQVFTRQKRC